MSRALMIHSSTDKQYSGHSYFRGQVFIQTHSHGTFLWILRPVSTTLASQFTQTFPQVSLTTWRFLSQWVGHTCAPGDPHSRFQCRSSFAVRHSVVIGRRGHAHKQRLPLHLSLGMLSDSVVSGEWGGERGFWVPASVYIPGGDLTIPVIGTATLGLACLPIAVTLGLAYQHIGLSFLWLVSKS
jgi:hypothetical protein